MLLPKFDYYDPETVEEACGLLTELGGQAKLLAGGTDLIVNMKRRTVLPDHVVSLSKIESLTALDASNGTVRIGARVTAGEIAESEAVRQDFAALAAGAAGLGSPLIRNLATIGGNLVTARPAADTPAPLLIYNAHVVLKSGGGERTVSIGEFFAGPGETVIGEQEILTEIILEKPQGRTGAGHLKLGVRNALEISLVNVAAFLRLDQGVIAEARVAMGSVAPTPILSPGAGTVLKGEKPSESLFSRAAEAAASDSRPIDDFRASAAYKRAMVETLTRRALAAAYENALKE